MNCDQAFECLTDPQCDTAGELQTHLDRCPRCRDMAEILAPALRFVSGGDGQPWAETVGDGPNLFQSTPPRPFLTEQAVQIAEEAAVTLNARRRQQQDRRMRSRLLALTVLAPVIALALFLADGDDAPPRAAGNHSVDPPRLGDCTRRDIAAGSKDAVAAMSAYEVVLACNVCHLMDRPRRRPEAEEHLKLQPAGVQESWLPEQGAGERAQVSSDVRLFWEMAQRGDAAMSSQKPAC